MRTISDSAFIQALLALEDRIQSLTNDTAEAIHLFGADSATVAAWRKSIDEAAAALQELRMETGE